MHITVLGAGAVGTAVAFDCAAHGHDVSVFDFEQFPDNIARIADQGGIHAEGDISGFAPIAWSGHDIDEALQDAELIYVVGPAYSTEPFGEAVAGKLSAGQTVIVTPSSCGGALAFKRAAGLAVDDDSIRVAETSTLHYAVRLTEPGRVRVFLKLKAGNLLAALPGKHTDDILILISDVYPSMEPGFLGIGAQPQLNHRYLNEDVGYGLMFMSKLGQQIGVATPGIDAVINVATIVMARDYRSEALRTPESLGIAGRSAEELAAL